MEYEATRSCRHDCDDAEMVRIWVVWVGSILRDFACDADGCELCATMWSTQVDEQNLLVISWCDLFVNVMDTG